MSLQNILTQYAEEIDRELQSYFNEQIEFCKVIFESMQYSLFAGGKRLRPILMMLTCELFGKSKDKVLPYACAIEMIHTYSLIHDDLPAMDNDDYRRGKLTNHKVFGEGIAILSGDALLNKAFEVMIEASIKTDGVIGLKIMEKIAGAAGVKGMIGGQVADLIAETEPVELEGLRYIHENKTGALIIASMVAGAIMGGASEGDLEKITRAAYNIGLAFQIQDDILDIYGDEEKLGKPIQSDLKNNKSTYVSMLGVDKAREQVKYLSEEAIENLRSIDGESKPLIDLTNYLISREF